MKFAVALAVAICLALQVSAGRDLLQGNTCPKPQSQIRCKGKCVNFLRDKNHCGSCNACPPTFACKQGGCVCPPSRPSICFTKCINMKRDPMNCGTCGNVCPSGQCLRGQCVGGDDGCGIYQMRCDGKCRNILIDSMYCGNCKTRCGNGTKCFSGGCSCPKSRPDVCNYNCTNTKTDPKNCGFCTGDCTVKFGASAKCVDGECRRG